MMNPTKFSLVTKFSQVYTDLSLCAARKGGGDKTVVNTAPPPITAMPAPVISPAATLRWPAHGLRSNPTGFKSPTVAPDFSLQACSHITSYVGVFDLVFAVRNRV